MRGVRSLQGMAPLSAQTLLQLAPLVSRETRRIALSSARSDSRCAPRNDTQMREEVGRRSPTCEAPREKTGPRLTISHVGGSRMLQPACRRSTYDEFASTSVPWQLIPRLCFCVVDGWIGCLERCPRGGPIRSRKRSQLSRSDDRVRLSLGRARRWNGARTRAPRSSTSRSRAGLAAKLPRHALARGGRP